MLVSILIPVKKDNKYLRECIENCLQLDYPEFEIVVLSDALIDLPYKDKVKVIPTGGVGPAQKRDMVIKDIKGEIIAFIDDDAYPEKGWLKNAAGYFKDENVAAVCGPAVTPESDSPGQHVSGTAYSLTFISGSNNIRYVPGPAVREVDDYPSCNFLIRKDIFNKVGRFNTHFWPGEDTILCLKITRDLGKKIIYDPAVLVYHHRRAAIKPHLRQIKSYALHRGYFVKKFPATSFKFSYFVPSLFVLGLLAGGILSILVPGVQFVYIGVIIIYLILDIFYSLKQGGLKLIFPVVITNLLTHLTYGIYFIKGVFSKRLTEEE